MISSAKGAMLLPRSSRVKYAVARALMCVCVLVVLSARAFAQQKPEDIKIIPPIVDKASSTVTLPAAFWNSHTAEWVEVALCGRPSDFLHETIVCATTTRTLLEQALRDIGCHDADAWADSVADFPRIRGDRFMVTLEFTRDGKTESFSLDELLTMQSRDDVSWGVSMGPCGFMFKGDPDRAQTTRPAAPPPDAPAADSAKILRDDPQIALVYKGLQSMSQSFADQSLAYDDWIYANLNRGRNHTLLPRAVFDSNGTIPVKLTLRKVTEEQLLTENARLWHDAACREFILKQLPLARQIDKNKADYWALRPEAAKLRAAAADQKDPVKEISILGRSAVLLAQIGRDYAALDAAWAAWAVDHAKFETNDEKNLAALKEEAALWKQHMLLMQQKAGFLAAAEEALFEAKKIAGTPPPDSAARLAALRGTEITARSRALHADNAEFVDYWHAQAKRIDPKTDPRDVWIKMVNLQVAIAEARQNAAAAGIQYGDALEKSAGLSTESLNKSAADYARAANNVALAEARLNLASIEFEISKREGIGDDPDLPTLKKQRDALQQRIKDLDQPTTSPATRPN